MYYVIKEHINSYDGEYDKIRALLTSKTKCTMGELRDKWIEAQKKHEEDFREKRAKLKGNEKRWFRYKHYFTFEEWLVAEMGFKKIEFEEYCY